MRRLLMVLSAGVGLCASSLAAAQTPNPSPPPLQSDPGSILALQKEAMQPTIQALNRQDATMRLRAFTPAEIREVERQTSHILSATGTECDVVDAARVGQTIRRRNIFEVACANGYGYILADGPEVRAYDCTVLARAAVMRRQADMRADIGTQCALELNGGRQFHRTRYGARY
jgi:hypothetical protein